MTIREDCIGIADLIEYVQECDARQDANSTKAGVIKIFSLHFVHLQIFTIAHSFIPFSNFSPGLLSLLLLPDN